MDASDFVERYWSLSVEADMPNAPFKASVSVNKYLIATQKNIDTIRANQWAVVSEGRASRGTPRSTTGWPPACAMARAARTTWNSC